MNGHNSARYLREAIDSLRAQTHATWELIFWDNVSGDDSEAIVRGYCDPRIHFHTAPTKMTLAEGRNAAIRLARGAWVAFLDCDDLWIPEKLERQLARYASADNTHVGLIYARTRTFSTDGDQGETVYRYTGRPLPEGNVVRPLLLEGNLIPAVSALISREALNAVGEIPSEFTFAEDYWLFLAVAAKFDVLCVQETCCFYRAHDESATYRNKLASHTESLRILESWRSALSQADFDARCAVYHTLIGLERLRLRGTRFAGLREIAVKGSLPFLLLGSARYLLRRFVRRQRAYS